MIASEPGQGEPITFVMGQSGNPAGRPPGSRNKVTELVEGLAGDNAEETTRKLLDLVRLGHSAAKPDLAPAADLQADLASATDQQAPVAVPNATAEPAPRPRYLLLERCGRGITPLRKTVICSGGNDA